MTRDEPGFALRSSYRRWFFACRDVIAPGFMLAWPVLGPLLRGVSSKHASCHCGSFLKPFGFQALWFSQAFMHQPLNACDQAGCGLRPWWLRVKASTCA